MSCQYGVLRHLLVVGSIDEGIPSLSRSIKSGVSMTIPIDVLSTKQPSTRLVLVTHRKRVVEPVRNVSVPEQKTIQINIDILQASSVHDTMDVVGFVAEDDLSSRRALIVTASLEGFNDGWSRVTAICTWLDDTNTFGNGDHCLSKC